MDQSNPSDSCDQSLSCDNDVTPSGWGSGFSLWEEQCFREAEDTADQERQIISEREAINQRLWMLFQASACSIAQLYKGKCLTCASHTTTHSSLPTDRTHGQSMWQPFQMAASSVTTLYRECYESQKKMGELCVQSGVQRRNRELMSWLKKRKRTAPIKQEELIAFICGKKHHVPHGRSPRRTADRDSYTFSSGSAASVFAAAAADQRLHHSRSPPQTLSCLSLSDSAAPDVGSGVVDADATDLQPFRDALALSSLTTAAAAATAANATSGSRKNRIFAQFSSSNPADLVELNAFMSEEFTRNMDSKKRSFPTNDVVMSSPTHKKPKFL